MMKLTKLTFIAYHLTGRYYKSMTLTNDFLLPMQPPLTKYCLVRYLVNVSFSAMFLSTYCTIAWSMFCFVTQVANEKRQPYHLRTAMLLPGIAAIFETKPRRLELGS